MTTNTAAFQLSTDAAEAYEDKAVPAIFRQFAGYLVEEARPAPGSDVLDVACGTGIVARTVAERSGGARIVGVDINEGMLAVARRLRPDLEWHHGDAADLPFQDDTFDAVLCQASLMYFPDRAEAVAEMARVTRPGGSVAVLVWDALENQTGYLRFAEIVTDVIGPRGRGIVDSYFSLGDLDTTRTLLQQAGLEVRSATTRNGVARFGSLEKFARDEIGSTPLVDEIDEVTVERLVRSCVAGMADFESPSGGAVLPLRGHIIVGSPAA